MKKEEIKSEELKGILCVATDKLNFDEITEEDLKSVKKLYLPGRKLNGEPNDINLFELGALENVEELTLTDFEINNGINDVLGMIPNIKVLKFGNCDFKECSRINTRKELELFSIFGGENTQGKKFPTASRMIIKNTHVSFDSINWDFIKRARFENCTIHDVSSLADKEGIEEIELIDTSLLSEKDENGEVRPIKRMEVSPDTFFSSRELEDEMR